MIFFTLTNSLSRDFTLSFSPSHFSLLLLIVTRDQRPYDSCDHFFSPSGWNPLHLLHNQSTTNYQPLVLVDRESAESPHSSVGEIGSSVLSLFAGINSTMSTLWDQIESSRLSNQGILLLLLVHLHLNPSACLSVSPLPQLKLCFTPNRSQRLAFKMA